MNLLLQLLPLLLLTGCFAILGSLFFMVRNLNENSLPLLKAVLGSNQSVREISAKLDDVSDQVEDSKQHQQKLFDHHRIILGSLNSQLVKLDIMLNNPANAQGDDVKGPSEFVPESVSREKNSSGLIYKLNRTNLPKTEKGMELLEEVFKRRTNLGLSNPVEEAPIQDAPVMLRDKLRVGQPAAEHVEPEAAPEIAVDPLQEAEDELLLQKRNSRRSILQLFNDRTRITPSGDERLKWSA